MKNRNERRGGLRGVAMVACVAMAVLGSVGAAGAKPPEGVNIPSYFNFKDQLPMVIRSTIRGVDGRVDKVAFEPVKYRVFVAATRSNAVYALNLSDHTVAQKFADLPEARGVVWLPTAQRIVVTCGGDGSTHIFKLGTAEDKTPYVFERRIALEGEADGLIVDADSAEIGQPDGAAVWVAHAMSLARLDVKSGEKTKDVVLPGRAEGMVIGKVEGGKRRLFVNVPRPDKTKEMPDPKPLVVVIDPEKGEIVDRWEINENRGNGSIAIDEEHGRLFVTTRSPAQVVVLNAKDGTEVARIKVSAEPGDVCYDARLQRLFVACGGDGGKMEVFERKGVGARLDKEEKKEGGEAKVEGATAGIDRYELVHSAQTLAGCRSAMLNADERLLIAATPAFGGEPTYVFVYVVGP